MSGTKQECEDAKKKVNVRMVVQFLSVMHSAVF